jgi:uncharacterized protein YaeQ
MALKSTVFKAQLDVSDLDRGYFATHALTLARHPSETDERMMVRLLAFALFASERLEFSRGLSDADDADLRETDLTGAIALWIEVGQPDARALQKACARAARVAVLAYGRSVESYWARCVTELPRAARIRALSISEAEGRELALLATRNMRLTCTIQESLVYLDDGKRTVLIAPRELTPVAN